MGGARDVRDDALRGLVPNPVPECVATGFEFVEGPAWHPPTKRLLFNDIPGDVMRSMDTNGHTTIVRRPTNMANGNTWDRSGRLLTCEHASSRLVREEFDGSLTTIAENYGGRRLNSPNDVIVASDGTVFFTDPIYGRIEYYGLPREPELPFRGLYGVLGRFSELTLLCDDLDGPNGLCLSRSEGELFVNDTERAHIRRFTVQGDNISGGEVWADLLGDGEGGADGMKIDLEGNLYCCGPGGVHVYSSDAETLGVISVPEIAANLTWGDGDLRTLYITASTSIYRCRTRVPGLPAFPAG